MDEIGDWIWDHKWEIIIGVGLIAVGGGVALVVIRVGARAATPVIIKIGTKIGTKAA